MAGAASRGEVDAAYFDEAGFSVNPVLRSAWTRVGEQKAVCRQRHASHLNVPGCLLHGELVWQSRRGRLNGAAIVFFMNELIKRLRRRTVVILDNASMRHAQLLKSDKAQWRARGLEFYYLPAYSLELNRVEDMWKQVKYALNSILQFDVFIDKQLPPNSISVKLLYRICRKNFTTLFLSFLAARPYPVELS